MAKKKQTRPKRPFTNHRNVKDGSDEDLTQEPETLKAFRDSWELGIHSHDSSGAE